MTIAPLTDNQVVIRESFIRLRQFRDELAQLAGNRANLEHLSMGMSQDYPIAIEEGATILRIGTLLYKGPN